MIKLRLSSLEPSKSDRELSALENETLDKAVSRALEGINLGKFDQEDVFQAMVNGHKIPPDLWSSTKLNPSDSVLIAPQIKSGETGQVFKQIALIAIVAVVGAYTGGLATLGPVGAGLITAAAGIVSSLVLNALIPPPVPDSLALGESYEKSQMYSIAGQSNQVKKFGTVPKVYGMHRVFPNIAANPYIELATDPETGELVQYLYAIYDFGLGPMFVNNISIGDTPLSNENFTDVEWNLVDPNRPEVPEGTWDELTQSDFTIYKGDIDNESLGIVLTADKEDNGPVEEYQATRFTPLNPDNAKTEITLNFTNPLGLYSYDSVGNLGHRSIALDIEFAKVGTDDWHKFNDPAYVDRFISAGGFQFSESRLKVANTWPGTTTSYRSYLTPFEKQYLKNLGYNPTFNIQVTEKYLKPYVGGTNARFFFEPNANLSIGAKLLLGNRLLGTIVSVTPNGPSVEVVIDNPLQHESFHAFSFITALGMPSVPVLMPVATSFSIQTGTFISRAETNVVYSSFSFVPKETGQFKVRVTRLNTTSTYTAQTQDRLDWSVLSTRFDRNPIVTDKRHVFLELRIKATNQLNGTIQNLSALCSSVLPVWNGTAWVKQETSNPAWVFADLLTGEVNKKAIPTSRLHLPSLLEWAEYCDEVPTAPEATTYVDKRFETNFVLDYAATLQTVLAQVAGAAQASLNIVDGKYGVLVDKLRTTPVQVFTPRNSKDFSSARSYSPKPHALRIKYVEPEKDWAVEEIEVYDDGYTKETATEFDELTTFACTSYEQAWRFGRYMLAQNRLRQESISLTVDFEHLVCTRGDYVQITQDVMRVGGTPARVSSLVGTVITIDDFVDIVEGIDYGYVLRKSDGTIATNTLTVISADSFDLDGDLPEVGDIIIVGEVGSVVFDCIVKSISPNDDLSATITLVEKADGVYEAESTGVIPEYDPQISATSSPDISPPRAVQNLSVAANAWKCNAGDYQYYVDLSWDVPLGSVYENFQVFVNDGRGFDHIGTTRNTTYRAVIDPTRLEVSHEFRVLAVSATGRKLELGAVTGVTATPSKKISPPSDVESLYIDITGEVLQLVWPQVLDCDVDEYLIRYSPELDATWGTSVPLMRVSSLTTLASTQARTGTYLIKAIDFNYNESVNAAVAITTIPNLFNLNIIDTIEDHPDFLGRYEDTAKFDDSVLLKANSDGMTYPTEGYYYFRNLLDLGDIYSVRLQSAIVAEGYTAADVMSTWTSLAAVQSLTSAGASEWDVETQYRSSEIFNSIDQWADLASIAALDEGAAESFTPWRKFIMGDATGRIFQFRLRLISNESTVTPRVFSTTIKADMPDRTDRYDNIQADATTGATVTYSPKFAGPGTTPNIQITIDDGQSGDYFEFVSKTLTGFQIKFYDKNGIQVARQFDAQVKGYGRRSSAVI